MYLVLFGLFKNFIVILIVMALLKKNVMSNQILKLCL